jgi:carbonic anhydrase
LLEKVFIQIPEEKEKEITTDVIINLSDYIPPSQEHFTYIGSLTTPPCTVGVDWIVFGQSIKASKEQLQKFSEVYANNARPVLPLHNRRVLKSIRN